MFLVRAAAAPRITGGAESTNSLRWCSPMPKTSRPTSSARTISSSKLSMRWPDVKRIGISYMYGAGRRETRYLKRRRSSSEESQMFSKILIAYDESPESGRALLTGIQLAKSLNAELRAVSVQENLPPFAGYIDAEVPGGTALLRQQAADYYRELLARARQAAQMEGVSLTAELVEGGEVRAIRE